MELAAGYVVHEEELVDHIMKHRADQRSWQDLLPRVQAIVKEEIEARRNEEATWPDVTDCDRLHAALNELVGCGIRACGLYSDLRLYSQRQAEELVQSLTSARGVRACLIRDVPSTVGAMAGKGLRLVVGASPSQLLGVGNQVIRTVQKHGLDAKWVENCARSIVVKMEWQFRMSGGAPAGITRNGP